MRIINVGAKNFRTLENVNLTFQSNYCTISGKNNAGKSAIVKIIQHFLDGNDETPFFSRGEKAITFSKDRTQWSKADDMEISICIELDKSDDTEVLFFIERFSKSKIHGEKLKIEIKNIFKNGENVQSKCIVDGNETDALEASEIIKKFKSTANLIVHNSTSPRRNFFYLDEGYTEVLEAHFTDEDRKKITDASSNLQSKIKQAAKKHKEDLSQLLGRLNEKYQVELTTIDNGTSTRFPLQIKLTDKSVEVPLLDWGAGTQNRTRVLMSILDVQRIRSSVAASDRSTPVFIVEEPESFLHPSAQAEFGQVLNALSEELKIQIIATTHSPYLNQTNPESNILLDRKSYRNILKETQIVSTSGDDWMLPFSEKLGIIPSEFKSWKNVINNQSSRVVLVEGEIDKRYFEIFKSRYPKIYKIPLDVEVVAYGGKDALKNTSILQFMIGKFGKVFVTYDLDAEHEVRQNLERIGLIAGDDFCAVGVHGAGDDCMEGLLPATAKRKVYSEKYELISKLSSQDTKARNQAKSEMKVALLDEFQKVTYEDKELSSFVKLFAAIAKTFN